MAIENASKIVSSVKTTVAKLTSTPIRKGNADKATLLSYSVETTQGTEWVKLTTAKGDVSLRRCTDLVASIAKVLHKGDTEVEKVLERAIGEEISWVA